MKSIFEVNEDLLDGVEWFDIEITGTKEGDFFYKKSVDYNKKSKSITVDDIF
jgi:ribonucleoside-diphosphate reductase beta chain